MKQIDLELAQSGNGTSSRENSLTKPPKPEGPPTLAAVLESGAEPNIKQKCLLFLPYYGAYFTAYVAVGMMTMFFTPWWVLVAFTFPLAECALFIPLVWYTYRRCDEAFRWWDVELGPTWYNCYVRIFTALFGSIYFWKNPDKMTLTVQWAIWLAGFLFNWLMIGMDASEVYGCCNPIGFDMWFGRVKDPKYHEAVKSNLEIMRNRPRRGGGGFLIGVMVGASLT